MCAIAHPSTCPGPRPAPVAPLQMEDAERVRIPSWARRYPGDVFSSGSTARGRGQATTRLEEAGWRCPPSAQLRSLESIPAGQSTSSIILEIRWARTGPYGERRAELRTSRHGMRAARVLLCDSLRTGDSKTGPYGQQQVTSGSPRRMADDRRSMSRLIAPMAVRSRISSLESRKSCVVTMRCATAAYEDEPQART